MNAHREVPQIDRPDAVLTANAWLSARIGKLAPLCGPRECLRIQDELALVNTALDPIEEQVRVRLLADAKAVRALPKSRRALPAPKKRRTA
jgi:hypothetical protein